MYIGAQKPTKKQHKMTAIIEHYENDSIKAFVDGVLVATCFITGYVTGKKAPKIEFTTEAERLGKFVAYCETKHAVRFEIKTARKYHLKWTNGIEFDIFAFSDEDAVNKANAYFNPNSGTVTQDGRFVGEIVEKPPVDFYIPRKTWKRRDRTNPRYAFTLTPR